MFHQIHKIILFFICTLFVYVFIYILNSMMLLQKAFQESNVFLVYGSNYDAVRDSDLL